MHTGINDYIGMVLSKDFEKNTGKIEDILKNNCVLFKRTVMIGKTGVKCRLYYMDGMVNAALIDDSVIRPLVSASLTDKNFCTADFLLLLYPISSALSIVWRKEGVTHFSCRADGEEGDGCRRVLGRKYSFLPFLRRIFAILAGKKRKYRR